ncbi:proline-rich protein 35 [Betta splendens]|uniref:Proline-rich protein 35 n=1 Tax=Betta splendens TaxID=158456 RepID=A0A6P7L9H3_BETSP|nr:proline-rich protein 35 [Betta splendens]XP_040924473.1 proline-rich protein 35 [Betta splendens]XP_055360553.1 proline-rich protein 35 [Betta splendens]XP_055360555.1 proline-rich protein 35 [Betta splendens]XP_055360556.1 proline-rich protein 35 [Betta splendens]
MSKDDACKVTSASKHKERKPKKPHYIPRPWGKPYNYKCFQCPFTCMEKSHLYNHMKYSLCKNSLSLLIESDWPYKKGNILHPDQLRPFQQAHGLHAPGKDELEQMSRAEERQRPRKPADEEGEERGGGGPEDEDDGGREDGMEAAELKDGADEAKKAKQPDSDLMADMLSLEDQLLRARSVEVEAQLKQYKLSKTCLTAPGLLSEQWRLLASGHAKAKAEAAQPRVSNSIPCYPPPPNLVDYQDPTGLNLSVLGVGYPLSPGLFSYMNSAIPAGAAAQTHAQLAQLPFLASAAQLMHPGPGPHGDRALLAPRLYYPFLCEHAFGAASGQSDAGKALKAPAGGPEAGALPGFQPKVSLWKVPALRPGSGPVQPSGWGSPQRDSPDQGYRSGDKAPTPGKDGKAAWGLKRTAAPPGNHEAPAEKKPAMGFTLDLMKNFQTASTLNTVADKLYQNSLQDAQLQHRPTELWYNDPLTSPSTETTSVSTCGRPNSQESAAARTVGEEASESVAALLGDLSKALQEYQEAERKISHLEKEDLPAQRHLWEHLSKIRSELSHIHQALERSTRPSDGPLDLSVKRDPAEAIGEQSAREDGSPRGNTTETEEEDEELAEKREDEEDESKAMRTSLESRKQSLDLLIKMSQASVVNAEALSPAALGLRPSPSEALWPSRTTKCEADSSVLLCPDGRSVVFTDISTSKTPKRPAPVQRREAQCPLSPLTAADS